MPVTLDGNTFYSTSEACRKAGINRHTFLRWVREKRFDDVKTRDRNGWRLFTGEDIIRLKDVIKDVGVAPVGFVRSARDATKSKNAKSRLGAQHDIVERILATLPNAVLVVSDKGSAVLANQAFYSTFSIRESHIAGIPLSRILPVKELSRIVSAARGRDKISLNAEFRMEMTGGERSFSATAISMPPHEILLVFMDLTESQERQEKLYFKDRMASIGELAAGVAHELGSPLSSIIMFTELLARRDLPQDILEDIKTVRSEAQRGAGIVKNLLTFARKNSSARQKADVATIIDAVLKLRAHEHKIKNIVVIKKFQADLPQVVMDCVQMQQVFLNIIVNAEQSMSDAHSSGTLTITAAARDGRVAIAFADDGAGISEKSMARIFDPFFTTKPAGEGTGLGLSICYGIVAQNGGRLSASSVTNAGATFTVELPADNTPGNHKR